MCGIGPVHPLESIFNSWVHLKTPSQADILRGVTQPWRRIRKILEN